VERGKGQISRGVGDRIEASDFFEKRPEATRIFNISYVIATGLSDFDDLVAAFFEDRNDLFPDRSRSSNQGLRRETRYLRSRELLRTNKNLAEHTDSNPLKSLESNRSPKKGLRTSVLISNFDAPFLRSEEMVRYVTICPYFRNHSRRAWFR